MFCRRYALPALVTIVASACWAAPTSQPASEPSTRPARLAYGFKTGEDVVYNLSILYEFPYQMVEMSGYSIYHIKSVNSVGYVAFAHFTGLGEPPGPEEVLVFRSVNGQPEFKKYFTGDSVGVFNTQGRFLELRKGEALPCSLGESAFLMLPQLPVGEETSWQRPTEYVRTDTGRRVGSSGWETSAGNFGFVPTPPIPTIVPYLSGQARREDREWANYDEVWQYSLGEATGDTVVINATCEFKLDKASLDAKGPLVWNLRTGRVQSLELKFRWTYRQGDQEVIIPVTVTASLASGEDAKKLLTQQGKRTEYLEQVFKAATQRAASQNARMSGEMALHQVRPGMENKDLTSDEVGLLLQELKARATHTVMQACDRLAASKPLPDKRREVIEALKPLLAERDIFIRRSAANAYGTWGAPADVQAIKDALVDEDDTFARDALRGAMKKIQARAESRPAAEAPAAAPAQ